MKKPHINALVLLSAATCISCASHATAELVVESWLVGSGVSDDAPHGGSVSAFSTTVQNPLQTTHSAVLGNSYASDTDDFAWEGDSAHFDLIANHRIQELHGDTSTGGQIYIIPTVDSFISATGRWQYSWPNTAIGDTSIFVSVLNEDSGDQPILDFAYGGNVGLNPPFGTLDVSDTGLMHAGVAYEINYRVDIYHYEPTPPGTYGWGSGEIHFAITPVPEPTSLALWALGLFSVRAHRSRRLDSSRVS